MNKPTIFAPITAESIFINTYMNCKIIIIPIQPNIFLKKKPIEEIKHLKIFFSSKYAAAQYNITKKFKKFETGYKTNTHFLNIS